MRLQNGELEMGGNHEATFTSSTAACLIVLAGLAYADPPVFSNVPGNLTVPAGANDQASITFTPPISVEAVEPPTVPPRYTLLCQWCDTNSVAHPAHWRHLPARDDRNHLRWH